MLFQCGPLQNSAEPFPGAAGSAGDPRNWRQKRKILNLSVSLAQLRVFVLLFISGDTIIDFHQREETNVEECKIKDEIRIK